MVDAAQKTVLEAMGVADVVEMPDAAWVLLRKMAFGESLEDIADEMFLEPEELRNLIYVVIGFEEPSEAQKKEAMARWTDGMRVVKLAMAENRNVKAITWDHIEAEALTKLSHAVSRTTNPSSLLAIATAANKAQRNTGGGDMEVGIDTTLKSGNLGSITLHLGARIRQQLSKPRPQRTAGVVDGSEMLDLEATRKLAVTETKSDDD